MIRDTVGSIHSISRLQGTLTGVRKSSAAPASSWTSPLPPALPPTPSVPGTAAWKNAASTARPTPVALSSSTPPDQQRARHSAPTMSPLPRNGPAPTTPAPILRSNLLPYSWRQSRLVRTWALDTIKYLASFPGGRIFRIPVPEIRDADLQTMPTRSYRPVDSHWRS